MSKRKKRRKRKKPLESSFEPKVNWKDVRTYQIVDIIQVVLETEYELINAESLDKFCLDKFTVSMINSTTIQKSCTN